MTDDNIDTFVYELTEYLDPLFPPTKNMGNFFDTDDNYEGLREFVFSKLEKFSNGYRNHN